MAEKSPTGCDRREFLQAGAAATATAATLGAVRANRAAAADDAKAVLPTRKLGKTGVDVTILNQGTWQNPGLDRLLRFSFDRGVRYFDTAKSYGSEPGIKRWLAQDSKIRKQIFLVTKDSPREPRELIPMLDKRLEALGTDYIDLFFVHALGDNGGLGNYGVDWPKSKEMKETIEAIKKSGKAKFVGFSTHHPRRAEFLEAAAEGGLVDAIMLQYTPWLDKDSALNKALDACWKKGIGLISMKQVAGTFGNATQGGVLDKVKEKMPQVLKDKGLTPYQGLLHAIWSDERIASSCVSMRNTDQITMNAEAARKFEPMKAADIRRLGEAVLAAGRTLCADCTGQCSVAAGTKARLGDLTRFYTYHEHHGYREEARRHYAGLTAEERDWSGADLAAAREACPSKLDFAKLLPETDELLG